MQARLTFRAENYRLIRASCSKTSQLLSPGFNWAWTAASIGLGLLDRAVWLLNQFRAYGRAGAALAILRLEDNATGIDLHPAKRSSATWGWVSNAWRIGWHTPLSRGWAGAWYWDWVRGTRSTSRLFSPMDNPQLFCRCRLPPAKPTRSRPGWASSHTASEPPRRVALTPMSNSCCRGCRTICPSSISSWYRGHNSGP